MYNPPCNLLVTCSTAGFSQPLLKLPHAPFTIMHTPVGPAVTAPSPPECRGRHCVFISVGACRLYHIHFAGLGFRTCTVLTCRYRCRCFCEHLQASRRACVHSYRTIGRPFHHPMASPLLRMNLDPLKLVGTQDSCPIGGGTFIIAEIGGQQAWVHAPEKATNSTALPLLIVLHGAGKNTMWNLKQAVEAWAPIARAHNMLVLYPEAQGSTWDFISSRRTKRGNVDFVQLAINRVRQSFSVDDRRIAVIGISDGGSMALSLATHNQSLFQAAISISAGFCFDPPRCLANGPKLFMKHGGADRMFAVERVAVPLRDQMVHAGFTVEHRIGANEGHVPKGWQEEFVPLWLGMRVQ